MTSARTGLAERRLKCIPSVAAVPNLFRLADHHLSFPRKFVKFTQKKCFMKKECLLSSWFSCCHLVLFYRFTCKITNISQILANFISPTKLFGGPAREQPTRGPQYKLTFNQMATMSKNPNCLGIYYRQSGTN